VGLGPEALRLQELAVTVPTARPVSRPRPRAQELKELAVPTLLLLAGESTAHDIRKVRTPARATLPQVRTEVVPGGGHHALPAACPPETGALFDAFLTDPNAVWPGGIVGSGS
jgi:hypothetical protein